MSFDAVEVRQCELEDFRIRFRHAYDVTVHHAQHARVLTMTHLAETTAAQHRLHLAARVADDADGNAESVQRCKTLS